MNNYNFKTAELMLNSFNKDSWKIQQAKKLFSELKKESADATITGITQSPYYQNIVNILGPYAVYYKIDQVLKLLHELERQKKEPAEFQSPYYARPAGA